MNECIEYHAKEINFSMPVRNSGYCKLEIEESDRIKMSFTPQHGLHRFVLMLFGLKNEPETSQKIIDIILSTVEWQFALEWLEDIVVFSKIPEEHLSHFRTVLTILHDTRVTIKLHKWKIFTENTYYLENVIRHRGLEIATHPANLILGLNHQTY